MKSNIRLRALMPATLAIFLTLMPIHAARAIRGGPLVPLASDFWKQTVFVRVSSKGELGGQLCAGVYWGKYGILTAAHCVLSKGPTGLVTIGIYHGSELLPGLTGWKLLSNFRIEKRKEFSTRGSEWEYTHDLALIVSSVPLLMDGYKQPDVTALDQPLYNLPSVFVGASKMANPESVPIITELKEKINQNPVLRYASTKLLEVNEDPKFPGAFGFIFSSDHASCKGDSGGPIYAYVGNTLELMGLVSSGVHTEMKCATTVRAVLVSAYKTWIDQTYDRLVKEMGLP